MPPLRLLEAARRCAAHHAVLALLERLQLQREACGLALETRLGRVRVGLR
jgi:hypothetical protein